MRRMLVVGAVVGLTWGGVGALTTAAQAAPASTTVGCTKGVGDSNKLVRAINKANDGGAKTIILRQNCTYTLTSPAEGSDGLPVITASITLEGSGSTITRSATAQFRILEVGSTGTLTASNLTVSGGHALDGADGTTGTTGTTATAVFPDPPLGAPGATALAAATGPMGAAFSSTAVAPSA